MYEVDITVPADYVVGATGRRAGERKNGDGTVTYTHAQEDVHDFAWTACPDFVEIRKPFTLDDPPVRTEMILLVHKAHLARRTATNRPSATAWSSTAGATAPIPTRPSPWSTRRSPPSARAAWNTRRSSPQGSRFFPAGLRMPEMVTIHEFGHGYWYGIVGSNEFEEAWLDEGINSYSEIKAMERYLRRGPVHGRHRAGQDRRPGLRPDEVMGVVRLDPIMTKSWEFFSGGSYAANVYQKAA